MIFQQSPCQRKEMEADMIKYMKIDLMMMMIIIGGHRPRTDYTTTIIFERSQEHKVSKANDLKRGEDADCIIQTGEGYI